MRKNIVRLLGIVSCCFAFFGIGWVSSLYFYAGEQAMGSLIESVSALGYLSKGDQENARKMLQLSAEGNVILITKYGTPVLDWYAPGSQEKWLQRYAHIRQSNPLIEYPDGGLMQKKVDEALQPRKK